MLLHQTNDSTALHLAASGGHADVVEVLLEAGASATDENAVNNYIFHNCYLRYVHVCVYCLIYMGLVFFIICLFTSSN